MKLNSLAAAGLALALAIAAPDLASAKNRHHNPGPSIVSVQNALNANGAALKVDGKWGPATRKALKNFQASHNLKPTGKLNAATRKALGL